MQPAPLTLRSVYAGPKSPLDLSRGGAHQTWHFCACSYLEHKPQKRGCRQPLPLKRLSSGDERGAAALPSMPGERARSWQLAWRRGIRDAPTFPAHAVARTAARPTRALFFFLLPALFSVKCLLPQQEVWTETPLHT